ncbi:hypothetical protein SARC_03547 [Sphaeroforma arctica JP610]|uniref:Integrase catalytic domain-containing protein n=1 Tax=Sphaeroforma arctica JP610 TaxID=667725 RepID=A0A0L0G5A8_9EUKA|nr:hypothetical protein SARC_03547 [Sphaeroforma arctica JP610]KNC84215.1 hypothetical protein SARC_03547 [Sphaeroforma arctica JP610]|eukprot:XP_014158117.1 hypothetical protein SARC_03547 [Sphaeroforma arctica JP610]
MILREQVEAPDERLDTGLSTDARLDGTTGTNSKGHLASTGPASAQNPFASFTGADLVSSNTPVLSECVFDDVEGVSFPGLDDEPIPLGKEMGVAESNAGMRGLMEQECDGLEDVLAARDQRWVERMNQHAVEDDSVGDVFEGEVLPDPLESAHECSDHQLAELQQQQESVIDETRAEGNFEEVSDVQLRAHSGIGFAQQPKRPYTVSDRVEGGGPDVVVTFERTEKAPRTLRDVLDELALINTSAKGMRKGRHTGNGLAEILCRTCNRWLTRYLPAEQESTWPDAVAEFVSAYNSTRSSVTGVAPLTLATNGRVFSHHADADIVELLRGDLGDLATLEMLEPEPLECWSS